MSWHDFEVGLVTAALTAPLWYAGYCLARALAFTAPYWEGRQ